LFAFDAATAHSVAMAALAPVEHLAPVRAPVRALFEVRDPRLEVRTMGLVFPSPVGLAAGLDKNAERARALASLGFGHVELGTVTAEAQGPNPPPNMFRLPMDLAIVNRLGFPNEGAASVARRIAARRRGIRVPVGVSIGKSRSVPLDHAQADYVASFRAVRDVADFVVVNVSSPNTKDLRALQATEAARPIFEALVAEARGKPVLVKIAPDLPDESIDAICDEVKRAGLAGVAATNTTISREGLASPRDLVDAAGAGGLSGKPLFPRSLAVVKRVRARLGAGPTVIGVGGIDSAESALAMLRVGADLVQVYTGFVYRGPSLPRRIARGLLARMEAEGAKDLAELVRAPRALVNGARAPARA
jgi:dihydroorotate dehydrogenase